MAEEDNLIDLCSVLGFLKSINILQIISTYFEPIEIETSNSVQLLEIRALFIYYEGE